MGRYYSGDIDGKFWFAVQPSDAADRFGVEGEKRYLSYTFYEDNKDDVYKELDRIKKNLGKYMDKLDKFFEKNEGYTDKQLQDYLKVDYQREKSILREYADYLLGREIADCLEREGRCCFEAEL